jgi:hypothetical protein
VAEQAAVGVGLQASTNVYMFKGDTMSTIHRTEATTATTLPGYALCLITGAPPATDPQCVCINCRTERARLSYHRTAGGHRR